MKYSLLDGKSELRMFFITLLVMVAGFLGIDIYLASMPHIMKFMHTDKQHIQQSVSLFLLGMGSSLFVYGPLSDKYGRKPMMLIGLSIASAASFASTITAHIIPFLISRLFQGIGAGACTGIARISAADVLHGDRFVVVGSYFSIVVSLSLLFSPTLGSYIQVWFGWQANFIFLGTIQLIALILYALFCPETNYKKNKSLSFIHLLTNYRSLLSHRLFLGYTLISGIGMAASMAYITTSSFIYQTQLHIGPVIYGWITAFVGLGSICGNLALASSIKYFSRARCLQFALVLLLCSGLGITFLDYFHFTSVTSLTLIVCFSFFALSFVLVCTTTDALTSFHDKRGTAGALFGGFRILIAFSVSAGIGLLPHNSVMVLGAMYFFLGAIGLCVYSFMCRTKPVT